jgi:hypothetical protein
MIVRVMTEGQYEVPDQHLEELRHEDEALLKAVETHDAVSYRQHLDRLLAAVRQGKRLSADALAASDLVLPPPDMSVGEAKRLLDAHQIY